MSIQEQFEAAVKIIQNLPKNGPYQPTKDMMLMFYSFYKQATLGPCNLQKPSFWDVINRAKWSAWSDLGNMSSTEAMNRYVEEIKKIIEQMSMSSNVDEFMENIKTIYYDENNSSLGFTALMKPFAGIGHFETPCEEETDDGSLNQWINDEQQPEEGGSYSFDDASDEVYEDSVENQINLDNCTQLHHDLKRCIGKLQEDFQNFEKKIENLEKQLSERNTDSKKACSQTPFSELSNATAFLLLVWPVVLNLIVALFKAKIKKP